MDPIPPPLRQPDITRLLSRAAQLRAHKPAVAYWCEYAAVVRILDAGLHHADDACHAFVADLMGRLEQTKAAASPSSPTDASAAIADNDAGRALMRAFAAETLARAERVLDAGRVTRTTADTFDAAATFLVALAAWGELDAETKGKIKFAKWNAARILKDIREGRDPNASNPQRGGGDGGEGEAQAALDPEDPEVRALMAAGTSLSDVHTTTATQQTHGPRPATVQDDVSSDSEMPPHAMSPILAPAPAIVSPTISAASISDATAPAAGTLDLPGVPGDSLGASGAAGGGYFDQAEPFAPSPMSQSPGLGPSAPSLPSVPDYQRRLQPQYDDDPPALSPQLQTQYPPHVPAGLPSTHAPPLPRAEEQQPLPKRGGFSFDEADMAQAQKHAKWAISALNFEDVPTAVKELESALRVLRAR